MAKVILCVLVKYVSGVTALLVFHQKNHFFPPALHFLYCYKIDSIWNHKSHNFLTGHLILSENSSDCRLWKVFTSRVCCCRNQI